MVFQVSRIDLTTWTGVLHRFASHDSRGAQAIETFTVGTWPAAEDATEDFQEFMVLGEHDKDSAQVVAKDSLVPVRLCGKRGQFKASARHFVQAAPDEERMAADEPEEAGEFGVVAQRSAIA